jgi:hypothetical protein
MTDDPSLTFDPTVPPPDQPWPDDRLPSLEQDRSVLAWLHGLDQLSSGAIGYLCDALLEGLLVGLPMAAGGERAGRRAGLRPLEGAGPDHRAPDATLTALDAER